MIASIGAQQKGNWMTIAGIHEAIIILHGVCTAEECAILKAIDFKKAITRFIRCGPHRWCWDDGEGSHHLHRSQSCKAIEAILENPCNRIPLFKPESQLYIYCTKRMRSSFRGTVVHYQDWTFLALRTADLQS